MSSSYPMRLIPAGLARRQPRNVCTISRRLNSTSSTQTPNPTYPLYPSVSQLLHEKGIPESDIPKIPASGPKGRLLKGDILAYVGLIPADYPSAQASRLAKLAHLDLSNVKIASPKPDDTKAPAPTPEAPVEKPTVRAPPTISIAISVSLAKVLSAQKKVQESLGVTIPLSTFLARATDLANDSLPRSPYAIPSADELFDEVLGADPITTSRGEYIPELNAFDELEFQPVQAVKEDLIDILSGNIRKRVSASPSFLDNGEESGSALNVFSLTVPVGDEKRARTFLERIKSLLTVEPGRLVL